MQRRTVLATLGLVGTGGCLRLQQTDAANAAGQETDRTGAGSGSPAESTAGDGGSGGSVTLSEHWALERGADYVWTDDGQFFTSSFDGVSLASPADGAVWGVETGSDGGLTAYPTTAFAVDDDVVIFGFDADSSTDAGANFIAFERASGERRWHVGMPDDGIHTRAKGVALAGETVVVAADHTGADSNQKPLVYGVDRASGERRWQTGTPDLTTGFVSGVTAYDGTLYVLQAFDGTYLLDPQTGTVNEYRESMRTSPWGGSTDGGTLFASWDGSITAYRLGSNGTRWSVSDVGETRLRPSVDDDLVVAGMGTGYVYAIETDSGMVRWKKRLPREVRGTALSEAHVWAIDADSTLVAYNRADGTIVYESSHGPNSADLGVVDDTLLVAGDTAQAYRIATD